MNYSFDFEPLYVYSFFTSEFDFKLDIFFPLELFLLNELLFIQSNIKFEAPDKFYCYIFLELLN